MPPVSIGIRDPGRAYCPFRGLPKWLVGPDARVQAGEASTQGHPHDEALLSREQQCDRGDQSLQSAAIAYQATAGRRLG